MQSNVIWIFPSWKIRRMFRSGRLHLVNTEGFFFFFCHQLSRKCGFQGLIVCDFLFSLSLFKSVFCILRGIKLCSPEKEILHSKHLNSWMYLPWLSLGFFLSHYFKVYTESFLCRWTSDWFIIRKLQWPVR